MKRFFGLVAMVVAVCEAQAQGTSEAVLSFSSSGGGTFIGTAGWTFQALNPMTVTDLGCLQNVVDAQGTIQVGLWEGNTLLAQALVSSSATVVNLTRYAAINPINLAAGHSYVIGAYNSVGTIRLNVVDPPSGFEGYVTSASTLQIGYAANGSGFASPSDLSTTPSSAYLGPNFLFVVPEPSVLGLLGLGALALSFRRR